MCFTFSPLRHLLSSLGFHEVLVNQGVGNYNAFIALLKQRLTESFIQNWRSRLDESTRVTFYKDFAVFQLQSYLDMVNVNKFSNAFSRLRVSSHRLEVESGRWVKTVRIPFDERKCVNCSVLEGEYHFVLECSSLYSDLRRKYISKYNWSRSNMIKFLELLKSSSTGCILKLSCYVYNAFNQRTNLLY